MDEVLHKHFVHMNILLNQGRSAEKKLRSSGQTPKNIPVTQLLNTAPLGNFELRSC